MRRDRQACLLVSDGGGLDELGIDVGKRAGIHADLDNSRPHSRGRYSICEFLHPARGQLLRSLRVGESRHILVLGRAVQTGVGHHLQTTRL